VPSRAHPIRPPPALRAGNRLLARLPPDDFERIKPHLRTRAVKRKQVFHRLNARIEDVVFPNGGVASVTAVMRDGAMVEVATVGDEGMLGMDVFFGGDVATGDAMLQVPDTSAEFMAVAPFKAELDRRGPLFECVQRYSQALVILMMHSTACMALHGVQERCCRWLLMAHDRVRRDEFHLSHEFLAMMLGSTRPTVTVVAGTLQRAGLIAYTHGRLSVLDRAGLEAASCECYATVKERFDRLGL
jgi:hypothetical protein